MHRTPHYASWHSHIHPHVLSNAPSLESSFCQPLPTTKTHVGNRIAMNPTYTGRQRLKLRRKLQNRSSASSHLPPVDETLVWRHRYAALRVGGQIPDLERRVVSLASKIYRHQSVSTALSCARHGRVFILSAAVLTRRRIGRRLSLMRATSFPRLWRRG